MLLGAIADDFTGGTDLALMLRQQGMRTVQHVGVPEADAGFEGYDAVVVSLKSRTTPADAAVEASLRSARALLAQGTPQLFFKYCSTFDSTPKGNIGPVAEALLKLTGGALTLACPAYPTNRRTVYKGNLFVGDVPLAESPMRDHPLTPMRDSNLLRLLQPQTGAPVGLVPHEVVRDGAGAISHALTQQDGIAVVDAIEDDDLRAIGRAAENLRLVTGGAGIALGLPDNFRRKGFLDDDGLGGTPPPPPGRTIVLAGSCSAATRAQIGTAVASGAPSLRIDPRRVESGKTDAADVVRFVLAAGNGLPPIVYSSADPAEVRLIQQDLGASSAGTLIERFFAAVAVELLKHGVSRFIVAGGETSGAVVEALGVTRMEIGQPIAPGVPWVFGTAGDTPVALALKSGNFGGEDFFARAFGMLQ